MKHAPSGVLKTFFEGTPVPRGSVSNHAHFLWRHWMTHDKNMQLHISNNSPSSRAFLEAASLDIADILGAYIAIHDDIFRFSWRRALPFPVLFESIDYDNYFRRLHCLRETLGSIVRQFPLESNKAPDLLLVLKDYCTALDSAMAELREICGSLMAKSTRPRSYTWTTYRTDLRRYHAAISRYKEIGVGLNALVNIERKAPQ